MVTPENWLDGFYTINVESNGTPVPSDPTQPNPTLNFEGAAVTYAQNTNSWTVPVGTDWATILDIDFRAQATQTLATDGPYTIGGYVWTKSNSANDRVPMVLTHGTGLVIAPNNPSDWGIFGGARTMPLIRLPFSSIPGLANIDWGTDFRLWLHGTYTQPGDADSTVGAVAGFDDGTTNFMLGVKIGVSSLGLFFADVQTGATYTGSTTATWTGARETASIDTTMMETTMPTGNLRPFVGTYTTTWPSFLSMLPYLQNNLTESSVIDLSGLPIIGDLGLVVGGSNGASNTTIVTIEGVRLDILASS